MAIFNSKLLVYRRVNQTVQIRHPSQNGGKILFWLVVDLPL
jgi:hypothetical protein